MKGFDFTIKFEKLFKKIRNMNVKIILKEITRLIFMSIVMLTTTYFLNGFKFPDKYHLLKLICAVFTIYIALNIYVKAKNHSI